MTMADRVAVMDEARIVQVGTPTELFERPSTKFVAGFLGSMNFMPVRPIGMTGAGCAVEIDGVVITVPNERIFGAVVPDSLPSEATVAIRPHQLRIHAGTFDGLAAVVKEVIYAGPRSTVVLDGGGRRLIADVSSQDAAQLSPEDPVSVGWDPGSALLYFE